MFNKTLWKYALRTIKNSPGRFISIVLMIGLGTFVYTGLTTTGPRMRYALKEFQEEAKMSDLQLMGSFGINEEDLKILDAKDLSAEREYSYRHNFKIKGTNMKLEIMSLNEKMDKVVVKEGRLPQRDDEILLDNNLEIDKEIGDYIVFDKERVLIEMPDEGKDYLSRYTFKIVGFGYSPYYLDTEGNTISSDGNVVEGFGIIRKEAFQMEEYQAVLMKFNEYNSLDPFEEEYRLSLREERRGLEEVFKDRPFGRLEELKKEAKDKIEEGEEEIRDARKQLKDAEADLKEARRDLDEGAIELEDGKETLRFNTEDGQRKIDDADKTLKDAREKLDDAHKTLEEKKVELLDGEKKLKDGRREYEDGKKKYDDALEELRDGEKKLADGKKELEDGKKEYEDGLKKYEDGVKKWEESRVELIDGERKYQEGVEEYREGKIKLEEARIKIEEAKIELDKGTKEYEEGKKELDKNYQELTTKKAELEGALAQIEEGYKTIEDSIAQAQAGLIEIEEGIGEIEGALSMINSQISQVPPNSTEHTALLNQKSDLEAKLTDLKAKKKEAEGGITQGEAKKTELQTQEAQAKAALPKIEIGLSEIEKNRAPLNEAKVKLDQGRLEYEKGYAEYMDGVRKSDEGLEELIKAERELEDGRRKLDEGKIKLDDSKKELEDAKEEIRKGEKEILENEEKIIDGKEKLKDAEIELKDGEDKLKDGEEEYNDGKKKLEDAEKTLAEKEIEYNDGIKDLEEAKIDFREGIDEANQKLSDAEEKLRDGEIKYKEGLETYEKESKDANEKLLDAEEKIEDAKELILKLKRPIYQARDRTDNSNYYMYYDSTNRLDILAVIFPIFFYFIALLLSLTTLTRMVEEYRGEIGTLKGLGYAPKGILLKFFLYGGLSGLLGGLIGGILGERILSSMIFIAYGSNFIFKDPPTVFFYKEIIVGVIIGLITGILAVRNTAKPYVKDTVATLMRPKAPKKGARIFLERIKPLWNRLGFMKKVSLRNMFRYKLRMLMTIFGVAGCVALLLFAFGIRNSIAQVIPEQFEKISHYDLMTIYDQDFGKDSLKDYEALLESRKIKESLKIHIEELKWKNNNGMDQTASLIVPKDPERINDFFTLTSLKGEPLNLLNEETVITDKILSIIDEELPKEIPFEDSYGKKLNLNFTKEANNHFGHYIFMTPKAYEKYFKEEIEYNGDLIIAGDKGEIEEIYGTLTDNKAILNVRKNETGPIDSLLSSMNFVIVMIIIVSSLLAIVVLYNLNNINIEERIRELSTVKVLGFYPKEMTEYIYRETVLLTIVAIIPGFIVGFLMHQLIMKKIVPDVVKFYEAIDPLSYIFSVLITIVFSIIVMIFVDKKLKTIDMVEALKGYE